MHSSIRFELRARREPNSQTAFLRALCVRTSALSALNLHAFLCVSVPPWQIFIPQHNSNRPRQFPRPINQRRPRRIQKLVPNHHHPPAPHRRHIPPSRIPQSCRDLGARPGSRPGQHNQFRRSQRHPFIPHPHARTSRPHLPYQFFSRPRAIHQSPQRSDITKNIRQRPRIHCQKRYRLRQNLLHRLRRKRHRTNQNRGPQSHHFAQIHFPAIAHRRTRAHLRHILAPARNSHQLAPHPQRKQNRSNTRRKRNDSQSVEFFHPSHRTTILLLRISLRPLRLCSKSICSKILSVSLCLRGKCLASAQKENAPESLAAPRRVQSNLN